MYKAIDMRLRPPYKTLKEGMLFTGYMSPGQIAFRENMELHASKAAIELSMELFLQEMDDWGIEKGVVMSRNTNGGSNTELVELVQEYPERFIGAPHIQPMDGIQALQEIDDLVVHGPCSLIYMEPGFRLEKESMHADDERCFPIYEKCQQENIPIILQYGGGKNSTEYYDPLDIFHIAEAFPQLKLCISHGGWPQVMGHLQQAFAHENVYISPDYLFSGYPGSQEYVTAANGILQDKMLFGSAYPLASLEDAVTMYLEAGLKAKVLPKVFYKNAARFLGLEDDQSFILADNHVSVK